LTNAVVLIKTKLDGMMGIQRRKNIKSKFLIIIFLFLLIQNLFAYTIDVKTDSMFSKRGVFPF
jgi:hypothetical protein